MLIGHEDPKSGSENVQDVYYLQSQNGNLFKELSLSGEANDCSEFEPLLQDTPRGIAWATEALGLLVQWHVTKCRLTWVLVRDDRLFTGRG